MEWCLHVNFMFRGVAIGWYPKPGYTKLASLMPILFLLAFRLLHPSLWQDVLLTHQGHMKKGENFRERPKVSFPERNVSLIGPLYLMDTYILAYSHMCWRNVVDIQIIKPQTNFHESYTWTQ